MTGRTGTYLMATFVAVAPFRPLATQFGLEARSPSDTPVGGTRHLRPRGLGVRGRQAGAGDGHRCPARRRQAEPKGGAATAAPGKDGAEDSRRATAVAERATGGRRMTSR